MPESKHAESALELVELSSKAGYCFTLDSFQLGGLFHGACCKLPEVPLKVRTRFHNSFRGYLKPLGLIPGSTHDKRTFEGERRWKGGMIKISRLTNSACPLS